MRRKYIVGNWKMNGTSASLTDAQAIAAVAAQCPAVDVALCPPATLIGPMIAAAPQLAVGGQDCHNAGHGAYTGDISAAMLADIGAKLVIIGHSERRDAHAESNELVRAKVDAALSAGLGVILCVGESLAVREAGGAIDFVVDQLGQSLPFAMLADPSRLAIAYEPIWAIGTGLIPSLDDIAAMHAAIRGALGDAGDGMALLYGGSVNGENAGAILAIGDVDGALVGGASLSADKFGPIIRAAAQGGA
ncbi:MAG: triose-phosphate isomerase [Sphingopyxis sp.]